MGIKFNDLKSMSMIDLLKMVKDIDIEILRLKIKLKNSVGKNDKNVVNTARFKNARKDKARIFTLLEKKNVDIVNN